jgi:hypothetical protein
VIFVEIKNTQQTSNWGPGRGQLWLSNCHYVKVQQLPPPLLLSMLGRGGPLVLSALADSPVAQVTALVLSMHPGQYPFVAAATGRSNLFSLPLLLLLQWHLT